MPMGALSRIDLLNSYKKLYIFPGYVIIITKTSWDECGIALSLFRYIDRGA